MEDITRNPDNPDRPDAWMWLFDDEDASRDATKKIRQMFFFPSYLQSIRNSSLITLKEQHKLF